MNGEIPSGLDPALLDDFFAEADDHLSRIRQALARLEAGAETGPADPAILEELFQNIHSFKGISAIAGLSPAEALAHASEDFLRLLRNGQAALTHKGVDLLMDATQKLEQMVGAFRSGKTMPGNEALLEGIKQECLQPSQTPSSSVRAPPASPQLGARIEAARARGLRVWKFTFTPSHELDAQGVNINSIREGLSKIGEILAATPHVRGEGGLSFEFLVSAENLPADMAAWKAKRVDVQPAEFHPSSPAGFSTESAEHNPFLAPSHVVRVDLKRLDELMRIAGEMVIHRSRLETQVVRLDGVSLQSDIRGVQEASGALGRSLRQLREAIMRVRLVSVAELFARMPFVIRDLSRQNSKKVRLKLQGQETAIDKYLIEKLKDPLLHLVRNAFTHGVESPEERVAASKPEEATIELKASTAGDSVLIQVRDDGKGIDIEAVLNRARQLDLELPSTIDNPSLLAILCSSGFSIRENADRVAGRGIGMGVVQDTVRELGGQLSLESEPGKGTQFTLRVPSTLAIAEALIVSAAGQTCAVPQVFVTEILHATESQVQRVNGIEVVPYRAGVLPVIRLAGLFQLPSVPRAQLYLLVITSERGSVGLLTEQVLGQREVVVSALRDPLLRVHGIAGATELGDGKPVLILDGVALTSGSVCPIGAGQVHLESN